MSSKILSPTNSVEAFFTSIAPISESVDEIEGDAEFTLTRKVKRTFRIAIHSSDRNRRRRTNFDFSRFNVSSASAGSSTLVIKFTLFCLQSVRIRNSTRAKCKFRPSPLLDTPDLARHSPERSTFRNTPNHQDGASYLATGQFDS